MIRWVNIVGAQSNGTHAQHGQRLCEWGPPPPCKYYDFPKHNAFAVQVWLTWLNEHLDYRKIAKIYSLVGI